MPNELIERWFSLLDPDRLARGLWWNEALSLVSGCTPVSEACKHCWSAAEAHMRGAQTNLKMKARYGGLTDSNGKWTGEVRFMVEDLLKPLRRKQPTVYAVWTDLYHPGIINGERSMAYLLFRNCPQHVFVVLTKRPEEMARYRGGLATLPNVVHGTTVELQKYEDRIGHLLNTPSAARFVSQEPALGLVDFTKCCYISSKEAGDLVPGLEYKANYLKSRPAIDLIITGFESGPGARPGHPDWARSTRDQCAAAGVPFFLKQITKNGRKLPVEQWPQDLQQRNWPNAL